jgi:hypothetical protein
MGDKDHLRDAFRTIFTPLNNSMPQRGKSLVENVYIGNIVAPSGQYTGLSDHLLYCPNGATISRLRFFLQGFYPSGIDWVFVDMAVES